MSSATPTAIVFGARGPVARAAAIEAHSRGTHIWLAMRDPTLAIEGISSEQEKQGKYTRVQAEMLDPESVKRAVSQSKATVAFTYVVHGMQDAMVQSLAAMKEAGIKYVVLLSSFTIEPRGRTETLAGENLIAKLHAQAEVALEESGLNYTAVRPMYFASNLWQSSEGIKRGEIPLYQPDATFDYLAPEDIGSVAGARIAWASANLPTTNEIVRICGPEIMSQREAWAIVSKEMGTPLPIKEISRDEFVNKPHAPRPLMETLATSHEHHARDQTWQYPEQLYKESAANVKKYTGREPMRLPEWVRKHKDDPARG